MKPIIRSKGTTETERILARLCESSFLDLWSYPSLFTSEGRKDKKSAGKELADMLVVFGTDIVLFSDKDIRFNEDIDVQIAWNRWKKKSIDASKTQLFGARKWILEHPQEIYFDARCENLFPFIDPNIAYRIHLVAVTKNSTEPASRHFRGNSTGSLPLYSLEDDLPQSPRLFWIQDDRHKPFVHVFDEVTLELVLKELDTAPDFIKYLRDKEHAIRNGGYRVIAGEEDFLAHYMLLDGPQVLEPFSGMKTATHSDFIQLAEGTWDHYVESGQRARVRQHHEAGYKWDRLISIFTEAILSATVPISMRHSVDMQEKAVRLLASEPRHARAALATGYYEKIASAPRNVRTSRIFQSSADPRACIILVLCPQDARESYDAYRARRLNLLHAYGSVAKLNMPKHNTFTLIGTEPGRGERRSEEILALKIESMSKEEQAVARSLMKDHKILSNVINLGTQVPPGGVAAVPLVQRLSPEKTGRNDQCPCASGRKYKKCCMPA